MANNLTPIVYDAATREHRPADVGDRISPSFVTVDATRGNLLQNKADMGLGIFGGDLVSSTAGNALSVGMDGRLYASVSSDGVLSTQPGNYIRYGNDHGLFLDGNDVLSNGRSNLLRINTTDGKVELTEQDLKDAGIGGGDVTKAEFEALKAEVTTAKADVNTVKTDVNTVKNDVQRIEREVEDVTVVSTDRNNVLTEGRDGGAYLDKQDIIDTVEDAGITGKVDVQQLINLGTDPLLGRQGDKLISGLSVQYNQASGRLDILGVNGQSVANTTIPTAVQLLEQVTLEDNPAGQPAGTYIHFQFRLTDGSISHVYLNVNKLAQFYSAGDGITIGTDGKISVSKPFVEDVVEDKFEDLPIVSTDRDNILTKGRDKGAYLSGDDIIDVIGDSIEEIAVEAIEQAIEDGKVNIVSKNSNNKLTAGTDGGAFLAKSTITDTVKDEIDAKNIKLVSDDTDNLLKTGSDGRPFLDPEDVPSGISEDLGNALKLGTDNKPFFPSDYGTL